MAQEHGRYEEAESLFCEALAITAKAVGKAHPDYAIRIGNLAQVLAQKGDIEQARIHLNEAMQVFKTALPPEHPHITETQRRLDALPSE